MTDIFYLCQCTHSVTAYVRFVDTSVYLNSSSTVTKSISINEERTGHTHQKVSLFRW